jgi:hypothetical protein
MVGDVIGEIGETGHRVGDDLGIGIGRQPRDGGVEPHIELGQRRGIEVIETDHAVEAPAGIERLKLLAQLPVAVIGGHIDILRGAGIEIDRRGGVILAIGGDRAQRQPVNRLGLKEDRAAPGFHILLRAVEARERIEHIGQHRRPGQLPRNFAMATARVGHVVGVIAGDAGKDLAAMQFDGAASGDDVLVVIALPGGQVFAETITRQPREGAAHPHQPIAVERRAGGDDAIGLIVAAIGAAQLDMRLVVQLLRHIFDRAADGVAAIERTLRPAQHLDPLDIIDIQHGGLRAVEIDIIEIDAHALLEARNRVLLAHAADKGRKGGVGAARGFQRDVGHFVGQSGDISGALRGQLVARKGRDGDRHR